MDAAGDRLAGMCERRLARSHEALQRAVEILGVAGAMLVDDHEIDGQPLETPVFVGPQQLANEIEVLGLRDPDDDDRQVAGDAVGPERRCAAIVPGELAGRWPERGIRVQDPVGEPLEQMGLVGLDPEMVELDLGLRPRERRRTFIGADLAILVG